MGRPVVPMAEDDPGGVPPWLRPLMKAAFFLPCRLHGVSHKGECNLYCLDCTGDALCSHCLARHQDHRIVQIRRSSYRNVVRASEVSRFVDFSGVQTYVNNGAKIVFLNERPQQRAGKGVTNFCEACGRGLQDAFRFCSLGCKFVGVERDPGLTLPPRHSPGRDDPNGSESDGSSTPGKRMKTTAEDIEGEGDNPTGSISPAEDIEGEGDNPTGSISPATPPTAVSYRTRSRKGTPRRAPFF